MKVNTSITDKDDRTVESYIHKIGPSTYECKVCPGKYYNHKGNLRNHIEGNHYTLGYICENCQKKFNTRNYFYAHVRTCQ